MLVAAAATLGAGSAAASLTSVGQISSAFSPVLGEGIGRLVFAIGVLGGSLVAAVVSSLALAWGVGEVTGHQRSLEHRPFEAGWFYGIYALCVVGAAGLVWLVPDLVRLNIAAQVLNVFLLPLVIGLLVALAVKALPDPLRLRGWHLWVTACIWAVISAAGLFGGILGWL